MLLSIGKAAKLIGISVSTIRLWERQKKLKPHCRTIGNHRRYLIEDIYKIIKKSNDDNRKTLAYCRVSSFDQKNDLERQKSFPQAWQKKHQSDQFELISDLGSGMNFKKRGLKKLLSMILSGKVKKLILCHQDRLLRFGNELIYILCNHFGVEVKLLEESEPESDEIRLARDVITIITVFSSKLYGRRSHEKRRRRLEEQAQEAC